MDYGRFSFARFPLARRALCASHGGAFLNNRNEEYVNTKLLCVIACAAFSTLAAAPVRADDAQKPEAQQEEKTRTAEADAPRKAAAEKAPAAHHQTQQEKMKTCNVEAGKKNLHGDERRAFMSSCLKG
jgi:shikimate kinase